VVIRGGRNPRVVEGTSSCAGDAGAPEEIATRPISSIRMLCTPLFISDRLFATGLLIPEFKEPSPNLYAALFDDPYEAATFPFTDSFCAGFV
jgi:hypothetical protein